MTNEKPKVYEGDYPYIFVSYAHADGAVMPIIRALVDEGYRVWYDDGIQMGSSFPDYIADHLHDCSCVLMCVSRSSLASGWCRNEVEYALDLGKSILPVYLEDVELTRALRMRLGNVQALYWDSYATDEEFNRKLFSVRMLDPCLKPEGKRRRGVQPRRAADSSSNEILNGSISSNAGSDTAHNLIDISGVSHNNVLAEYSWTELKLLSHAIARAYSNADALVIAGAYHLVDSDGRLRGDDKPIRLRDGSSASVRILGFRHDVLADGTGRAGISFEFTHVSKMHAMNESWTNNGGWERSVMRSWLNDGVSDSGFLALLPDDLSSNIVQVRKMTNNQGRIMRDDTSAVSATNEKLWLLSMTEVYGKFSTQRVNIPWSSRTYDAEGRQYQLYVDRGVTTASYAPCAKEGRLSMWWLRSPAADSSHSFHCVVDDGSWRGGYATDDMDVSPCFCL